MDDRTVMNKSLQTSCHLNSRLPVEKGTDQQNKNLSNIDQQAGADNETIRNHNMTAPIFENASGNTQRSEGRYFGSKQGDMVFSLLSVLGTHNKEDMSRTLLAMSASFESCVAMRQSGCLPLLIHLLHGSEYNVSNMVMRSQAAAALHNIVHVHCEDQRGRQEARVLRLLEQIRGYCDYLRTPSNCQMVDHLANSQYAGPSDYHPGPSVAALMKLSFDEEHRHAVCTLGGVQAIAELLQMDHETNGNTTNQYHITMRRYACMALTNLTFGDGTNKALLCSMVPALKALVQQLESSNEDLCQVAASVLRNLSWHADFTSKRILRDVGAVPRLMRAALVAKKESTLKSLLSALWNFSSHCVENKADICATEGALQFLIQNLTYRSPLKTLSIIENCGGILRNISSHVAVREDYRAILRQHGCLQILLKHLRSPSLTVVSNACGTLWNLSARCPDDQKILIELGAMNMLKNLVHSKHKMISMGSAAALKNLLSAMPALGAGSLEPTMTLSGMKADAPGLHMRRQRALENELEQQNLSETCDNMESPQVSPTESPKLEVHVKSKHSPAVASLLSSSRMTSSLRGQLLPVDPVHAHCHPGNQGNVSSLHASFDGVADKKRVQEILHRSNKLLQDRQSPVVCDPVAPVIRDITRIAGSSLDVMTGSHSQFQDVKMMHSFSSYCEPTASTSPETSPIDKQMMEDGHVQMAASKPAKRFYRSSFEPLRQTEEREGLHIPSAVLGQVKGQPSSGLLTISKARLASSLAEEKALDISSTEFDRKSSSNGNTFSQNRLSIAGCDNIFSFESEDAMPEAAPPLSTDLLYKEPTDVPVSKENHSLASNSRNDDALSEDFSDARHFECASIYSFESSQSRMNSLQAYDSGESKSSAQNIASSPIWETENDITPPVVGSLRLEHKTSEDSELQSEDSVLPLNHVHQHQLEPKCRYVEKFIKHESSSGENADEFHMSSDALLSPDMYEEKNSSSPGFRRLSSSSNDGSRQDDVEPMPDTDIVCHQDLPRVCSEADVVVEDLLDQEEATFDLRRFSENAEAPFEAQQKPEDPLVCTEKSDSLDDLETDIQAEAEERFPTPLPPLSQTTLPQKTFSLSTAQNTVTSQKTPLMKASHPTTLLQMTAPEAASSQMTSPSNIPEKVMSPQLTSSRTNSPHMTSPQMASPLMTHYQMTSPLATPQKSFAGVTPTEITSPLRNLPQIADSCTSPVTVPQLNSSPMTSPTKSPHKRTSPCMTPPQMTSPLRSPHQKTSRVLDCFAEKLEVTRSSLDQMPETSCEGRVQEKIQLVDDRNASRCSSDVRFSIGVLPETTQCSSSMYKEPHHGKSLPLDCPAFDTQQLDKDFDEEFILVDVDCDDKTEIGMVNNLLETSLLMPRAEPRDPFLITDARHGMIGSLQSTSESIVDIMNESFPDLSSSLISDMATSHEDVLVAEVSMKQKFSSNPASCEEASFDSCKDSSVFMTSSEAMNMKRVDEKNETEDFELVDATSDMECDEISMEQERALEENANLILSELEMTTVLESGSSEMRLLECETLSLVSNDDEDEDNLSDGDVSEASCSLSLTSVAHSEPASERSSNMSRAATINIARPAGPRIVKPAAMKPVKQQQEKDPEDGPKAIRGRRKALYSAGKSKPDAAGPNLVKVTTVKPLAVKTQMPRKPVVPATQSKPATNSGTAKPVKPTITRSSGPKMNIQPKGVVDSSRRSVSQVNRSVTPSSSGTLNKTRAPSLPNERKPITHNRQTRSAPAQTKTVNTVDHADGTRKLVKKTFNSAPDKVKQSISVADKEQMADESSLGDPGVNTADQEDSQDRPKPPIKQDTFVKDAPSSFSIMVIDNDEEEEKQGGRGKEKQSDMVSRCSVDSSGKMSLASSSSQSTRRPAVAGSTGSTPKPGLRQAKSDAIIQRRNPVSESQANRSRASSAVSATANSREKSPRGNAAEISAKTRSFAKRPTSASKTTKLGSNTSIASVGRASRNGSAHMYDSSSASGERVSSVSPAPTSGRSENTPRDTTYRKTSAIANHPSTGNSERSVRTTEENAASRNSSRQQVRSLNKRPGMATSCASGVPTLTRSSTYDKLTDEDRLSKDQQSEGLEDFGERRRDTKQPEVMATEIDPRRLTRVLESKFRHVVPNSDEDCIKKESPSTPKSQDREELTLELESQVSITDSLYSGQGVMVQKSTMGGRMLERRDEPTPLGSSPENQTQNVTYPAMNSRSSSTLPASFFSRGRFSPGMALQDSGGHISPQMSPSDDAVLGVDTKSGRKTLRYKEGRKIGFGLWKRNNSSKDKPEEDGKTLPQQHDAKLGSPVRKVFGWFRRGSESSKKNSTSKIPAPESNRSNETNLLDNCRTRTADFNSNQTRNGETPRRGTNFLLERQAELSSVRANSPLRAAIVQPFNYKPLHSSATARGTGVASEIRNESSSEPMTKTEMLLARRRKSRAVSGCRDSIISDDSVKLGVAEQAKRLPNSLNSRDPKSGFLVTSV